ncbi:MAG: hypothetical protein ABUS48_05035, partial [Pseudomonadota bacterium]
GASIFHMTAGDEGAPALRVTGGVIVLESGARLVTGDASGSVELVNVAVNGQTRSGHFTASDGAGG